MKDKNQPNQEAAALNINLKEDAQYRFMSAGITPRPSFSPEDIYSLRLTDSKRHELTCGEFTDAATAARQDKIDKITELLLGISNEARLEIFYKFCMHCGTDNNMCKCWNEE